MTMLWFLCSLLCGSTSLALLYRFGLAEAQAGDGPCLGMNIEVHLQPQQSHNKRKSLKEEDSDRRKVGQQTTSSPSQLITWSHAFLTHLLAHTSQNKTSIFQFNVCLVLLEPYESRFYLILQMVKTKVFLHFLSVICLVVLAELYVFQGAWVAQFSIRLLI